MIRPGSTMPTASLLSLGGQRVVVDCGLGVARGITDQGMSLKDLSLILITHLHSDHYLELGPLLHTAWCAGLRTPVQVWGPQGLDLYWQGFLASMAFDIATRIEDEGRPDLRALVSIHLTTLDAPMTFGALAVTAIRTIHPPLTDSFAYRFEAAGKTVVFSGDTARLPALESFAAGADLLIHEAMLAPALPALMARIGNGDDRLMHHWLRAHTTAEDAAKTAAAAGVRALALHHLIPSDDPAFAETDWLDNTRPHFAGAIHIGRDGLKIPL
ncbi:MAG: MBL fold metallo-hydrolase [Fuscovulum sp.]|nr:MBL fold metallo-hydrolase [Fuscovulum sp.]